jgi:hypothetical protein
MDRPRVNEIWTSTNCITFCIKQVNTIDGKNWIHYQREYDQKDFHCLEEAFTERFTKYINDRR